MFNFTLYFTYFLINKVFLRPKNIKNQTWKNAHFKSYLNLFAFELFIYFYYRMLPYADLQWILEMREELFVLPFFPVSKPSDNTAEGKLLICIHAPVCNIIAPCNFSQSSFPGWNSRLRKD